MVTDGMDDEGEQVQSDGSNVVDAEIDADSLKMSQWMTEENDGNMAALEEEIAI